MDIFFARNTEDIFDTLVFEAFDYKPGNSRAFSSLEVTSSAPTFSFMPLLALSDKCDNKKAPVGFCFELLC